MESAKWDGILRALIRIEILLKLTSSAIYDCSHSKEENIVLILNWISYACWGLAAIVVLTAVGTENFAFVGLGIALGISGVLYYALSEIVSLLKQIRDGLAPVGVKVEQYSQEDLDQAVQEPAQVSRSMEEIAADLERLKTKAEGR